MREAAEGRSGRWVVCVFAQDTRTLTYMMNAHRFVQRCPLKVAQPRTAPVLMDGFLPSGDEHAVLHLGSELSGHEELAQGG
jgi:hypothetical protein